MGTNPLKMGVIEVRAANFENGGHRVYIVIFLKITNNNHDNGVNVLKS